MTQACHPIKLKKSTERWQASAGIGGRFHRNNQEWLKSQGEGYQTRLNNILRAAMQKDLRHHHQHK
ncbi:MAG: BrnA antitoxin family protein [Desulfocucumaceae bacterium]